ncbi:MAG: hypothetical protein H8D47_04895 [Planctomycetes bacterium]|nr:hypothetical protein [Planctomycetota bacterium]
MKKTMTILIVLAVICIATLSADAAVRVRGHYRSNGTYVQQHYRSNPDGIRSNNWSSSGNTNPYTGKVGTRSYSTADLSNIGFMKNKPNVLPCYPSMINSDSPL